MRRPPQAGTVSPHRPSRRAGVGDHAQRLLRPLSLLLLLAVPAAAEAQADSRGDRPERSHRRRPPRTPPTDTPNTLPASPSAPENAPTAAIRVACNDGLPSDLCDVVRTAATRAAGRAYRIVDPARLKAVETEEEALIDCYREDCRVVLCDRLKADRLIEIRIQSQQRTKIIGTVTIYDAAAKGISGDTEIPPTRREATRIDGAIADAVEYVISSQRLTASVRLDVDPEGAKVLIDDVDRGTARDFKLFLGPHTVRVERIGYQPQKQTVNVTQTGARLAIKLQQQPVSVRFEWAPEGARLLVDGDPIDGKGAAVVDLLEGKHRVQLLPPKDSEYDARDVDVQVRFGMDAVRILPVKRAELRVQAPSGYALRIDGNLVQPTRVQGNVQEAVLATSPGSHTVTATSWRGLTRSATISTLPGAPTDVQITPPPLAPGLLLGAAGLLGIAGGAAMIALHGTCSVPDCTLQYDFSWQRDATTQAAPAAGYLTLALSGAALVAGTVWFAYNAANHPAFHRETTKKLALRRLRIFPAVAPDGGALVVSGGL